MFHLMDKMYIMNGIVYWKKLNSLDDKYLVLFEFFML